MKKCLSILLAFVMLACAFAFTSSAATLVWPVPGHTALSQGYHSNSAIDISDGSIAGATIVAAFSGTVKTKYTCTQQHHGSSGDCGGFGTGLIILGDDNRQYVYAHMQGGSIPSNVYVGARVNAGQTIGRVGTTGNSSGYHLHFGIWNASGYAVGINPQNETYTYSNPTNISVTWQLNNVESITNNNAKIGAVGTFSTTITCTEAGFYLGTSQSNLKKNANPDRNLNLTHTIMGASFLLSKYQETLKPGTTYYYKIYLVANGVTYTSPVGSFKTKDCSHTWNSGTVTKAATCSATGVRTYTCTACGGTKTESIPINPSNHINTVNSSATASTCTVNGYTAGVYCNDCKQYISGHQQQPLAAHTITIINQRDATQDAEGYTGDEYCTVCKQTIKQGTVIQKLDKPADPTPDTPSNPQPENGCKWCGKTHTGFFGGLVGFFHRIFAAIFGARH